MSTCRTGHSQDASSGLTGAARGRAPGARRQRRVAEGVDLGGQGEVLGPGRPPPARARPGPARHRARGRPASWAPGRRTPGPRASPRVSNPASSSSRGDLVGGEPAVPPGCRTGGGPPGPSSSDRAWAKWPAIARATTAACRWLTSRLRVPPGRSTAASAASAAAGSSTISRTPWQSTTSALPSGDQVGQVAQVALASGDPVGDPALVGATRQDREGVGAGVDDHDPVAELGDPDREPAGAAADVDHGGRPVGVRVSSTSRRAFHTTAVRAALRRWRLLWPGRGSADMAPTLVPRPDGARLRHRSCPGRVPQLAGSRTLVRPRRAA